MGEYVNLGRAAPSTRISGMCIKLELRERENLRGIHAGQALERKGFDRPGLGEPGLLDPPRESRKEVAQHRIARSSLIPIELHEIVREPRPLRMAILALNIAVVIYLFKRKDVFE